MSRVKRKSSVNRPDGNIRERLVGRFTTALRAMPLKEAIHEIKTSVSPADLFTIFPRLFKTDNALEKIHGPSFPRTLEQLFVAPLPYISTNRQSELIWAICRCIQHSQELKEFTRLRELFEKGILQDAKADCFNLLDEIESKFGQSTWLIQARLCASQHWGGLEETQRLSQSYESEIKDGTLLQLLFWFFRRRVEATAIKDHLKTELSRVTQQFDSKELDEYLTTKLFEQADVPLPSITSCLYFEGQSSILDLYEMLVHVLQAIASFSLMTDELHALLTKPINVLFARIDDRRLRGPLRRSGTCIPETFVPTERALAIEAYSRGDYEACIELASSVLDKTLDDIPIFILALRAHVQVARDPAPRAGILKVISNHLLEILRFTEDTYSSAHEIMTLADRFYAQAWISYIRAVVMYELRQESEEFPPLWLRDMFVRDPWESPFSAVAMEHRHAEAMLSDARMVQSFPITLEVYKAVTTGNVDVTFPIDPNRALKYQGTYHLAFGNPHEAVAHFKSLMGRSTGPEKTRCAGAAALASRQIGDLKDAAEIIVRSFLDNPNVPSALPIRPIVQSLDEPSKWPYTIAVPLLFELYLSYSGRDKLADLRYAFEVFQQTNNISDPKHLLDLVSKYGEDMIIAYLERVWRPEIMRQTILYDGTREIEEARIQVCRLLSEMVPDNAARYLEEIKERVKQQEIAKGTTLIEQSKVYVDIDAIKKTLRAKLGDSYARYRMASGSAPSQPDELVEDLKRVISQSFKGDVSIAKLLSSLHLLDTAASSEADAQFSALFTEVTSEFLRGDHGLNAYLSTRVRHGALSNTLRKPVEDEKLVTPRDENKTSYVRNTYWLPSDKSTSAREILDALDSFSAEFDGVLDHLKDKLLQIRVLHGLSDSGENPDGLFIYRSSNLEQRLIQANDRSSGDMEQLLDSCVNTLWEKTDENLLSVRNVIGTTIRDRLMQAFDKLTARLGNLSYVPVASDLLNAVARARTNTQISLGQVSSWFRRSEVYDRQDYSLEFPVQIALNMVRKTISTAAQWDRLTIVGSFDGCILPGRTLDSMVYIFYGLLENAIKRSRVSIDDLSVRVELSLEQGRFHARMMNNVDCTQITSDERDKLDRIREAVGQQGSNQLAQVEGRSGLRKVWLAINAPIFSEPALHFELKENEFLVDLSYSLEKMDYENTAH